MKVKKRIEGFWWPLNSNKAHYFQAGRSLCGKWGHFGLPEFMEIAPNETVVCKACAKKLKKIAEKNSE